jgi:SAM-dependent methyltransferase
MPELPWYQELFGEDYLRVWAPVLPPERTAGEVEGILSLLDLPPGSAILDLCCGHGRHALPLAESGYRVTGQDLSEVFLEQARREAAHRGLELRWVHGDMRTIPFTGEFDAVINLFTAFGYLESDAEDQKVLDEVHRALKPGGCFLLEIKNREQLVRSFAAHSIDRHPDGLIVLEERSFDLLSSRTEVRVTLIHPDGERKEYRHSVRAYSLTEIARMFTAAGLRLEGVYGGLDGSELTLDSRRLVALGRK